MNKSEIRKRILKIRKQNSSKILKIDFKNILKILKKMENLLKPQYLTIYVE